ncbi:probable G-protein coupled receptor 21 [Anneissia japonica]|uniref:probable G-protein coupled receptor 21 n=1 Tax=Anneissia japonica TaxID=1529436 RepID=UPI0014259EF3|nr:probable G-protein coupled receptor 21 [Anneissia japonica]
MTDQSAFGMNTTDFIDITSAEPSVTGMSSTAIIDVMRDEAFKPNHYLITTFIFTAMILIIGGNLIVITVFHYTPSLRNPTSVFITSLAIADLGVGISCLFSIQAVFAEKWSFSFGFCKAVGFSLAVVVGVSIMTLGCISIDRYIAVTKPLRYYTIVTKKRARLASLGVWILSFIIFIPSLFGWGSYEFSKETYECRLHWSQDVGFSFYVISILVIPNLLISTFCYYHIYKACQQQVKKLQKVEKFSTDNATSDSLESDTSRKNHERTVAKIFLIIVSAFYITWLPFIIIRIIEGTSNVEIKPIISFLTAWMGIFNSFLNCLIYSITHKSFQAGLKSLLRSMKTECQYHCGKLPKKCMCCNRV